MGSADVLETDTKDEVCFSGPIHSTEPEDECKHPDTGEGAEAEALKEGFDALEATEEVHKTNQEQSESPDRFPNISPLNSPKRGMKRTGTLVPDSDVQQETKKSKRAPNWNRVETQKLINFCSLQTSHGKRNMDWEAASNQIPGRTAKQCRQRYDTLLKSYKKIRTFCLDKCKVFEQVTEEEFRSMKLDRNFLENDHWYEMIDRCHSPTLQSSSKWDYMLFCCAGCFRGIVAILHIAVTVS